VSNNDNRKYKICTNCVMDTTDPEIVFDNKGVCDHCNNFYNNILPDWNTGEIGSRKLNSWLTKIKSDTRRQKYNCIIGLSGGMDSSYLLYMAKEKWGLNPLVFVVDTGWNLPVSDSNIEKIISKLDVDVHKVTINHEQMMNLQLAYFKSQVPYQDIPQDHVIFAALYNFAAENHYKYILTGGNYSMECVREPDAWVHCNDLRQIKDIFKEFGRGSIDKLPTCSMFKYKVYYRYFKGVQNVKLLDYIPYEKEAVIKVLHDEFGWVPYKNKHYENRFTRFYEGYWMPKKFGYDKRKCYYSSLILTKQMARNEALGLISEEPYPKEEAMKDMDYISDQLGVSMDEFMEIMQGTNKTYMDYKSSKTLIQLAIKVAKLVGMEKRNFR
jgi:N-acetyl sugar amidotransferase